MLVKNELNITGIYKGETPIKAVYKGSNLVWSSAPKYTPIEYLESTGTQFIDSDILATDTTGIYADFTPTGTGDMLVIGTCAKTSNGRQSINPGETQSGVRSLNLSWNALYQALNRTMQPTGRRYTASVNLYNSRQRTVDGVEYDAIIEPFTTAQSYNIGLFGAYWRSTNPSLFFVGKIYKAQITNGSELVRDFIPVLDENGVPCMFDTVNWKAYYNAGSGDFKTGEPL